MAGLFRSRSCGLGRGGEFHTAPPSLGFYGSGEDEFDDDDDDFFASNPISTPFIGAGSRESGSANGQSQGHQFPILPILLAALRKSLVTCSVEREDVSAVDISWPTNVQHVSHVTFDRFNGFLGLPVELEPEVPRRVPSASQGGKYTGRSLLYWVLSFMGDNLIFMFLGEDLCSLAFWLINAPFLLGRQDFTSFRTFPFMADPGCFFSSLNSDFLISYSGMPVSDQRIAAKWFMVTFIFHCTIGIKLSASVFGVSAQSMQCSYDQRGNSVPTILLMLQKRLYSQGGLQAEGIFRINAENGQEEYVRNQLNKGLLPRGIDVHCLAGLIKAWLRELPTGVLDSLTPEQVMHCNTEDECTQLVKLLPPTEAALLDWTINLMTDVVQHEHHNKMNARNIAMVFAPNMTQMADPLTALIHAVQVMNFLKTLIMKTLQEREESAAKSRLLSSCTDSPSSKDDPHSSNSNRNISCEQTQDGCAPEEHTISDFLKPDALDRLESDIEEKFWSSQQKSEAEEEYQSISGSSSPVVGEAGTLKNRCTGEYENGEVEGILDRLSLRKGVRKLCRHPIFHLSKPVKKTVEPLGL
ncbi:Rho GTPase-activating protein 3 [Vitis vinifera]|uniref:Rho GTPase-activating protein 3 n=1 Tax=Vitis vinifera TaxID=29760 RepID=A0A438IFA2_VITVI|nr:Rho GTPase-activating protein 3 [Vitis vinifera]